MQPTGFQIATQVFFQLPNRLDEAVLHGHKQVR